MTVASARVPTTAPGVNVTDGTTELDHVAKLTFTGAAVADLGNGNVGVTSNNAGVDAQTAVAGAAASAAPNVVVTSEALVGATTYALTLTDPKILATSVIQCTLWESTGAAIRITGITVLAGSVEIDVAMASLTGTIKFNISIRN